MKINFYLDQRTDKDSLQLIRIYIGFEGQRFRVSTGQKCKLSNWSVQAQRMKKDAKETNALLDSMKAEVERLDRSMINDRAKAIDDRKPPPIVTINDIKNQLSFIQDRRPQKTFFDYYDKYIEQKTIINTWSDGTILRMSGLRKHLVAMDKIHKLSFGSIDSDFYMKFIKYHQQKGFTNGFTQENINVLKWFLKWAAEEGYNTNLYYAKFKYRPKKPSIDDNIVKLNIDELLHLYKLHLDKPHLEKAKDVFIFGCFTGMRYSELKKLKKTDIQDDKIIYTTEKTIKKLTIPLNKYSRPIWEKYKDKPGEQALPVYSNAVYNNYLKEIGKLAGFKSKVTKIQFTGNKRTEIVTPKWAALTTHTARKTFLSTAVYLKIPIEIAIEMTGQTYEVARRYY